MSKRVYFHIVDPAQGNKFHPVYQYDYIPLAQGLKILGYEIFSNKDYWKGLKSNYLFKHDAKITPFDCHVNVFSGLCEHYNYPFDQELMNSNKTIKVLIEQNDSFFTPLFSEASKKFDYILHKKSNGRRYPSNCVSSWAFGLSDEIIELAQLYQNGFANRQNNILCNFRYGHTVRNYATNYLKDLRLMYSLDERSDEFDFSAYDGTTYGVMLSENGGRHRPNYIERLANSKICATFGGFFYFRNVLDNSRLTYRFGNYLLPDRATGKIVDVIKKSGLYVKKTRSIYQWDSWRFWEAFACGCVNLNVDLGFYGIILPEMPVPQKHYIGLNFHRNKSFNESLMNISEKELEAISVQGQKWAIDNYSPEAVAKRFIKICNV